MGASFPLSTLLGLAFSSVESEAREKEAKAKEKDQRNEAQKLKRAARDACKDEWKQIKIRHDNTVLAWKKSVQDQK